MKRTAATAVMLLVFVTGCNNGSSPVNSWTQTPFSTQPATTAFPVPTNTSNPTSSSPSIQSAPTIGVATLNAVATTDAMRLDLIEKIPELAKYNTFCYPDDCTGVGRSDNGQWIYFSNGNVIGLFRSDGQKVGEYTFYEVFGHRIDFHDGYLYGIHWSKDGRYLYLASSFGDGGPEAYFGYSASLIRVDLESGTWEDTGVSGVLSFSPNEKYVVYGTNNSELRVRDLNAGDEKVYNTPNHYLYFGEFVWSPDGRRVVFVGTPEQWEEPNSTFALFMIELEDPASILLYEYSMPFYYPVLWTEENKVLLHKYQQAGEWTMDLSVSPASIQP